MSSRNRYLNEQERQRAVAISRALLAAQDEFRSGSRDVRNLIAIAEKHLKPLDKLQYLELVDSETLEPAESPLKRSATLCVAAYIGSTRLIDNMTMDLPVSIGEGAG